MRVRDPVTGVFAHRKTNFERVRDALAEGHATSRDIAERTGLRRETCARQLRRLWLKGVARVDHGLAQAGSGGGTVSFVWEAIT